MCIVHLKKVTSFASNTYLHHVGGCLMVCLTDTNQPLLHVMKHCNMCISAEFRQMWKGLSHLEYNFLSVRLVIHSNLCNFVVNVNWFNYMFSSILGQIQFLSIAMHCTMQLSIEIGESKIFKSKGPVFTQFCSKF